MPDLLILRLHPTKQISPSVFLRYLQDLTITAYDLSYANPRGDPPALGSATSVGNNTRRPPSNAANIRNRRIFQHYKDVVDPVTKVTTRHLESVATAVIEVEATSPPAPEYPTADSYDLRLEIQRASGSGTLDIIDHTLYYNVPVVTVARLPNDQTWYFRKDPSAYVELPAETVGLDPSLAYVELPPDGGPPRFDQLVGAVNLVLAMDPGGAGATLEQLAPLSAAQSKQVAEEIVWNRALNPPPPLPRPLGEMYTKPPIDPSTHIEQADQDRAQFEAQLRGYYAGLESEATRLAGFIYSASAAVVCERLSHDATEAGLTFPVLTGAATPTSVPEATVLLTGAGSPPGALAPAFTVPAAVFYALGATLPPQVGPEQRYDMARLQQETHLLDEMRTAIESGIVASPVAPLVYGGAAVNADQAARRLHALSLTTPTLPTVTLDAAIGTLVTDWLSYHGAAHGIDTEFWAGEVSTQNGVTPQAAAYLNLILHVVTGNHNVLIHAIEGSPHNVQTVADLVSITDAQWRDFFLPPGGSPQITLLPPFTQPGTPQERVEAFIRALRRFFAVQVDHGATTAAAASAPPALHLPFADTFAAFTNAYSDATNGSGFVFGSAWDGSAVAQAIGDVFPGDPVAQAWLGQTLDTIEALFEATDIGQPELQFSLMEALYARGFTSLQSIRQHSGPGFEEALTGSVAYPHAARIYAKAMGSGGADGAPGSSSFTPVNPDGLLTDCVPPPHLSPLGPVEYLHELLRVCAPSTCDVPFPKDNPTRLGLLLAQRRGDLGGLLATGPNLHTPLPLVDLVNESLEKLTDDLPAVNDGAVYDTAGDQLAGHRLRGAAAPQSDTAKRHEHDPRILFATLPEHSSPATPVERPGAYTSLRSDFTSPMLPYPQALDIDRSYLEHLGTNRFETMRRFRRQITEPAIDPAHEPPGFQSHLWRLPVRFDIALEYLRISQDEYSLLYSQDIVTVPTPGRLLLREVYGFAQDDIDGHPWSDIVVRVPEFIARTGLTYCEFLDLWDAGYVAFERAGSDTSFPDCQPCCPDGLVMHCTGPSGPLTALRKLAVFIRLWRSLQQLSDPKLSFTELRDICDVLALFNPDDTINPDFLRQLAALLMLRDLLRLPLTDRDDPPAAGQVGDQRTHLLALWTGPSATKWSWAEQTLLARIEDHAEQQVAARRREPELMKLLSGNLDPISRLAGFDPSTPWFAHPAATLRLVEVLGKIYVSDFTVSELLFLFTTQYHGYDRFLLPGLNEALDTPLALPDDEHKFSLWRLRENLQKVHVSGEEAEAWTWPRIDTALRREFGYTPVSADDLLSLGEHFFPDMLERLGYIVDQRHRQYRRPLAQAETSPLMWNAPPDSPFRYDPSTQELWLTLPVPDEPVIVKLSQIRQLNPAEQAVVRDLYFAPRAALAPFAAIFDNFDVAVDHLVQEPDEHERWRYFRHHFALFHQRCHVIAEHLADHVVEVTGQRDARDARAAAWQILKRLCADENLATTPWEEDSGAPPDVTWTPRPSGSSFAALLGLLGTGVRGEFSAGGRDVWHELRGPFSGFGHERDEWNAPVPAILPPLSLTLTLEQQRFAAVRNGFALRDVNAEPLGGGAPFRVRWSGVLLIEHEGPYRFFAGVPAPRGGQPDFGAAEGARWRLELRRGQRSWFLLNHGWEGEDAADHESEPLVLRRGAYEIAVDYEQTEPTFARAEDVCPRRTGFQIKYAGPDSEDEIVTIPECRLFQAVKAHPLGSGLDIVSAPGRFLRERYYSSLRDIRRTYQRAFKALLLAHRFRLCAEPVPGEHQSELGYLLDHGTSFQGTSYYRVSATQFRTHHAYFDVNLLPVADPYRPPPATADQRVQPSAQRQAALFDSWERIFDYCQLRSQTHRARQRPAWLLFYEAAELQPDNPAQLLRHLGVDLRHANAVLTYFAAPEYVVTVQDLQDERWAIRAWQAEKWLRELQEHFRALSIGAARPHLWASDDPGAEIAAPPLSGNENLTRFVQDGSFENGAPRRYEDLKRLNDTLRLRARDALLAYLCGMDRVPLPWRAGQHVAQPRDLSDLLLQDVEASLREHASRIEDAISAVQAFVQRARLGLEPGFDVSPDFIRLWEGRFATFRVWQACKRREIYHENWIEFDDLDKARQTEAFRLLEGRLRRLDLTAPEPGGMDWWPGPRPPAHDPLVALQATGPSDIQLFQPGPLLPEGLGLMDTPEHTGQPSRLAPVSRPPISPQPPPLPTPDLGGPGTPGIAVSARAEPAREQSSTAQAAGAVVPAVRLAAQPSQEMTRLPLWFQAAIKLGTRFVRVAAAGEPPASTCFEPRRERPRACCCDACGQVHAPTMDEYYFWLEDARRFEPVTQDADVGAKSSDNPAVDPTSDWHRPSMLPHLLAWPDLPLVHLRWCRVHNGEFQQPRQSEEGLPIDPTLPGGAEPELDFTGRTVDSLRFTVTGAPQPDFTKVQAPPGTQWDQPGFRYDLATDAAVVLPQVMPASPPPADAFPKPLPAYPFFAYFAPGAPVEPASMFSVALAVASVLRTRCRFEEALHWYELVRKPLEQDNGWPICAEQQPPDLLPQPTASSGGQATAGQSSQGPDPAPASPDGTVANQPVPGPAGNIARLGQDEPCCITAPAAPDRARERSVLLHYLEALIQWADALMCRNAPEAFQQAIVVLDVMQRVLGNRPRVVQAQDAPQPQPVSAFVPRQAPLNPRLLSLYERLEDRFELIRSTQNGRRLRTGWDNTGIGYGGSTFPDGWRSTDNVCADRDDWCLCSCGPYRFSYLVQRGLELAASVRALGAGLLAAFEKSDAEYLASLRATHERQMQELTRVARQNQWRDADWQVQALQKTKEEAETRKRHYETLIRNDLNAGEHGYESLLAASMAFRAAGNRSEAIAEGVGLFPDFWLGAAGISGPVQLNQLPVGSKRAEAAFATAARIMNAVADIAGTDASLRLTQGGWDRREDEWRHQVEVTGIEIEQIERQILAAERRRDVALRELNNQQRLIEQSIQLHDFLRDKFTNQDLYLFLQQETAALYRQTYELARDTARRAQLALNYELGDPTASYLPEPGWDNLHEGLLAGEHLEFALHRMERAYLDNNCREYELTKHISLRLNFPLAFLQLQLTGHCEVELPEWLFDLDYPGHYLRRIKNVRLTIPSVVGPYTGIHCRLTLLSSRTRIDPRLATPSAACCGQDAQETHYREHLNDSRIIHAYAATEAVATSTGQNDAGLFELNFRDERYLPFEFAGAISRWRIELPPENNQFDFRTLSDVVLHLSFTAREGGETLRAAANHDAQLHLPGAGLRLFDMRHDFPDAWHQLRHGQGPRLLPLTLGRQDFPFLPSHHRVRVNRLELFFRLPDAEDRQTETVRFLTGHHVQHGPGEECNCHGNDIACIASAEWPGVYHGVLKLDAEPPLDENSRHLGVFHFAERHQIIDMIVVCGYEPSFRVEARRNPVPAERRTITPR